MILIHLGYEREGLERSYPGDVPHGWLKDRDAALCGARLLTSFDSLLFATPGGLESDGRPYDTLAHNETFGQPKCVDCLRAAARFEDNRPHPEIEDV